MLALRVCAPFATFRTFTAGAYRPTAPFLTPSAAYGLLLNIAAIESRLDDGISTMTRLRPNLPPTDLAIGELTAPRLQRIYQQLHNYPVGTTGKERQSETKGNKYNIQPIRREFLSDLDACILLDGNDDLEARVREGLRLGSAYAPEGRPRYGVPFLGDNSFLISRLTVLPSTPTAHWYERVTPDEEAGAADLCRLTIWIDRAGMAGTVAPLFRRTPVATAHVPDRAWVRLPPPPPN
jgi:CRISPR-associated protein Cas5t